MKPAPPRPDGRGAAAEAVRRQLVEALERRAAAQHGATRRLLEARLAALRQAPAQAAPAADVPPRAPPPAGPLAALVERLARTEPGAPAGAAPAALAAPPDLKAVHYFRGTWARLRAERRMAQVHAALPDNAGPLNSQRLVHRALSLMRELSPAYLQRFMAHAEALAWLEQQTQAAAAAPAKPPPRARAGRKPRGRAG